ncbi:MAG: crotonase/enoyl-CoA hydratase family protein [bacterium]|nr:crotonase/enoyl-CoA hydratase family protein [bacterium]
MSEPPVTMSLAGDVALIRIDDGKVNALTPALLDGLWGALDPAEGRAGAVVLAGRPGVFCAGLDLNVMRAGGRPGADLLHKGTEIFLRLAEFPRPVVAACTGHALAAGAVLLLCSDVRVCSAGDFKIGLNEVAIGIALPELVVDLARARLSPRHFTLACNTARIYSPAEAVDVGFLDRAHSSDATGDALEAAAELAQRLDAGAFARTRQATCRGLADSIIRNAAALMEKQRSGPATA